MFERFDDDARRVIQEAGEIAARREREKTGEDMPRHVRVQVKDVRAALTLPQRRQLADLARRLLSADLSKQVDAHLGEIDLDQTSWQGGFNDALSKRMNRLRDKTKGSKAAITIDDLREVMR